MDSMNRPPLYQARNHKLLVYALVLLALASLVSCNFIVNEDEPLKQTQSALNLQQTQVAQTATAVSAAATSQAAQVVQPPQAPPPDLAATQVALSVQATMAAQQQPPPVQPPAAPQQTEPPPGPQQTAPVAPPAPPADFTEQMKSASILLFEDIVADPRQSRFVKKTLDSMGLRYKDDGNAVGWLKTDLLGSSPNGKPWDLVILAMETRGDVSGEYFEYLNNVLNQGSAVIVEAWHLDEISEGTVSTILVKCGVQVYPYFSMNGSINDVVLWPLPDSNLNPVMSEPNSGMSFSKVTDTWLPLFDLGSLMYLTGQGDAQLLVGRDGTSNYKDGALATCMGGQLTLQTFSSHSMTYQTMGPLWENYIYNALRFKLLGGGQ